MKVGPLITEGVNMNYQDIPPQDWTEEQYRQWRKDLGQRLRRAIEKRKGKRKEKEFAEDVDISQGSLSEIISGKSTPSAFTLLKIDQNSTISMIYLLRGK